MIRYLSRTVRRLCVVAVVGASLFAATQLGATAASAANGKPARLAIPDWQQAFDFSAGSACRFELAGTPVSNSQYIKLYPTDANGDTRQLVNGILTLQLTNVGTGKSIIVNVSGPATLINHADFSVDANLGGSALVAFIAPFNPRGPATYIYTGHTVLSFNTFGLLTLVSTTDSKPFDVCAALS